MTDSKTPNRFEGATPIPNVRRALPGDEEALRSVRLRALAESPVEFGSTLEREEAMSLSEWREWLSNGATFFLEHAGSPVGLVAGFPHWHKPGSVFLISMWVHPSHRGKGGADTLVASVLSWAKSQDFREVLLHVTKPNMRARRLYERCGFRATGQEVLRERDGLVEVEMRHLLDSEGTRP